MPVEAGTAEYSYVGNGSTVTFAFPSRFLTDDDIKVSLNGVEQSQSTYTVLGAGAANGGSIVFAIAPAAGVIVLLLRKPSPSQLIDFVNGQTVLEGTLDNALDRLTMVDQYALRTIDRTVRLADLDLTTDMQLPIRANRIGKVLGFGAVNGEPIALNPNDAQNNRIVNLAAPTALNDAARLQDVQTQAAANGNVPLPILAQVGYFLKATATGTFGWVAQTLGALAAKNTVAAADIDAGAVIESKIGTGAVSYAKIQNVTQGRVLGRTAGAVAGGVQELPIAVGASGNVGISGALSVPVTGGLVVDGSTSVGASSKYIGGAGGMFGTNNSMVLNVPSGMGFEFAINNATQGSINTSGIFSCNLTQSAAGNGYVKLPSGIYIQWGTASASTGGDTSNFPIAFPNTCWSIVAVNRNQASPPAPMAEIVSASQFKLTTSAGTPNCNFIAIGN
jgi:hypothetical protein